MTSKLSAPVLQINSTNDKAGVKITIPKSKDLKAGQCCLLWISLDPDQSPPPEPPAPAPLNAQVNCGPDESFTIPNGTADTEITTESGAFERAVQILRGPGSFFTNGTVYLFYSLSPGQFPDWTVSESTAVEVNFS